MGCMSLQGPVVKSSSILNSDAFHAWTPVDVLEVDANESISLWVTVQRPREVYFFPGFSRHFCFRWLCVTRGYVTAEPCLKQRPPSAPVTELTHLQRSRQVFRLKKNTSEHANLCTLCSCQRSRNYNCVLYNNS